MASSMKIMLYELELDEDLLEVSLSLHTKKADQRAMSDSRVQREITLFQMTFEWSEQAEWWRWCRFLVLLTFVQKYKTAGGVHHKQYKDQTELWTAIPCKERFSQQTNADVIMGQTEDGNQHGLVVWISVTCLPPLCDACGFLSPTMHLVPYNLSMNDDFYSLLNRTPWRHWGRRRRRGPGANFKCKKVFYFSAMNKPSWHSYFAKYPHTIMGYHPKTTFVRYTSMFDQKACWLFVTSGNITHKY